MPFINHNGKIVGTGAIIVPADSWTIRYGYGLVETLLIENGSIFLAMAHWQRLWQGMEVFRFSVPKHFSPKYLETEIYELAAKCGMQQRCRIRLQIYGGQGGLYDRQTTTPEYIIECFALPDIQEINQNGLVIGIAADAVKCYNPFSPFKTANALVYIHAAQVAVQKKWNDALVVNEKGNILESSIANLFWIKDEQVYTPPVSDGCIAGVMRAYIINELQKTGIQVTEKQCTRADLYQANEIFLTNAVKKIRWVKVLEEYNYTFALTKKIAEMLTV